MSPRQVSIVDYGMGNLHSVKSACEKVGLDCVITDDARTVRDSAAVILPGVGAFGQAMETLEHKGLVQAMRESVAEGKPFMGICLGMQLMMSVSYEFGRHEGLGLFPGTVRQLDTGKQGDRMLKVPHIGWNRIVPVGESSDRPWQGSPLEEVPLGAKMYFVHSFYVTPEESDVALTVTEYAGNTFCSALGRDNVWGFQFHPERSGPEGISVYQAFARWAIN